MTINRWIGAAALVAALMAGCGGEPDVSAPSAGTQIGEASAAAPVEVKLALNWIPEMEHGGYYAALVHGYYEEAGLRVTILPGGANAPVIPQVDGGQVEFGVENADRVLMFRARGADVVALHAPLQTSPRCLVVHDKSPIRSFADLKDCTLAMSPSAPWAEFVKKTLPLDGVEIVPNPTSLALFLDNPKMVQQGYVFSEPFLAENQGKRVRSLMVSDLGFNPYTSLLIAKGKTAAERPDVVKKMVAATDRGWRKYLESPAETHKAIHDLNPAMPLDVLEKGYEAMKPLIAGTAATAAPLGSMTLERWTELSEQLLATGIVKPEEGIEPAKAFTTEFLPQDAGNAASGSK